MLDQEFAQMRVWASLPSARLMEFATMATRETTIEAVQPTKEMRPISFIERIQDRGSSRAKQTRVHSG